MTEPETNVRRVYQTYLYATCFVTVLITLLGAAMALTSLIRIIAPGLFSPQVAEDFVRKSATGSLLSALIFGGLAFGLFAYHWALARGVREELSRVAAPPPPSIATSTITEVGAQDAPTVSRPAPTRTRTPRPKA